MKFSKGKIKQIIKEELASVNEMFHYNGSEGLDTEMKLVEKNINTIITSANELKVELETKDDVPEWVQEKIAVTAAMINSVLLSLRDDDEIR